MPAKGRVDRIDIDRALQLTRELSSLQNQSDFVACVSRIRKEFGGYDGYARNLKLLFQNALVGEKLNLAFEVMKLLMQMERASADMTGSIDAFEKATHLLSDEELEQALQREARRAIAVTSESAFNLPPNTLEAIGSPKLEGP